MCILVFVIGLDTHPALARFAILQEQQPENGLVTLLAKSKQGSLVAIKVLLSGSVPDDVGAALGREGSAQAKLTHEAVVNTRAVILESDLSALVTEFVPGISLQRLARFATERNVRLPDDAAWFVMERIFSALTAAHEVGVVHGTLSPSCVVVGWDGTVKVGDFGLGRMRALASRIFAVNEDPAAAPVVSPEEARGAKATDKSDVFCAALVGARLATGRTPFARFRKSSAERMLAMAEGLLVPLSKTRADLPAPLKEMLDRATAVDPAQRATARDVRDAIRASFDAARGKESLVKLLGRWRSDLERSLPSWERKSFTNEAPPADVPDGLLALATPDERPSSEMLVGPESNPMIGPSSVPSEEAALAPTEAAVSMSRLGAVAADALAMPLPAARITMPPVPVYGGPVATLPPPKEKAFKGPVAALIVGLAFTLLLLGAGVLFWWLLRSPAQ